MIKWIDLGYREDVYKGYILMVISEWMDVEKI